MLPLFLAFPLYFGFVLFRLPSARVLGVSHGFWVCLVFFFWEGLLGFLVGFGGCVGLWCLTGASTVSGRGTVVQSSPKPGGGV